METAIFRINYKSDFILTLESDAGWLTPFCIKFWTGAPSQAYFAGYDGETYTHCAPVDGEPTKLVVQFDDHHLPIGDLKCQIAYHFTVADFPTSVEDEVLNQASVTIEVNDAPAQVMLDLNGETAPEIEFSLPSYANEAQRIANEEDRIAAEQQRIANEDARIAAEETRQQNEQQRINQETARVNEFATLKSQSQAATRNANDAATLANQKAQLAADKAALADDAATLAIQKAKLAADKAALANDAAQLANEKAALAQQKAEYAQQQGGYAKDQGDYAKDQGDYAKAQGDIAQSDHERAETDHGTAVDDHTQAGNDHTRAESDHGIAADDHTQAGNDHTRAESDHGIAADDHTQAGNDHTRAESDHGIAADDHTQAGNDHTRAESDHTRAESDHAAVEVYVDSLGAFDISAYHATGGVLAKYADLTAALGTNGANIPDALRKGGMSVKFVLSSDNKYVQYRCTANAFTTNVAQWQGVDDEPKEGSINFVESGGIYDNLNIRKVTFTNQKYSLIQSTQVKAGTKIAARLMSAASGLTNIMLSKGTSWTVANVIKNIPIDGSWIFVTVETDTLVYVLQYETVTYSDTVVEVAIGTEAELIEHLSDFGDITNTYRGTYSCTSSQRWQLLSDKKFPASTRFAFKITSKPDVDLHICLATNNVWIAQNIVAGGSIVELNKWYFGTLNSESVVGLFIYQTGVDLSSVKAEVLCNSFTSLAEDVARIENSQIISPRYLAWPSNNLYTGTKISISYSNNTATINFNGNLGLCGTPASPGYVWIPQNELTNVVLANLQYYVYNLNSATCSVKSPQNLTKYDITLLINIGGKVYSPIAALNDALSSVLGDGDGHVLYTDITIQPTGTPNTIASAIRAITDNGIGKRYRVFVKNGTYEEIDIVTKDYVDIIGEDIDNTIIYTNGNATYNTQSDYHFSDYANTPVNEVPIAYKHTLWHISNSTVSNLTIKATECKYPVHQDNYGTRNKKAIIRNCKLVDSGCWSILGVGVGGTQHFVYENTIFVVDVNKTTNISNSSLNIHNWNNQEKPAKIEFINCTFLNCGDLYFSELGSTQDDEFSLIDCRVDNNSCIIYTGLLGYYREGGQLVQDIDLVPYSINFRTSGGNIPLCKTEKRKLLTYKALSENIVYGKGSNSVAFGMAVELQNGVYVPSINGGDNIITAMNDTVNNQVFVNKGNRHIVYANADNYTVGDGLAVENGVFKKSSSNIVAYVVESVNLSSNGYLLIKT